MAKNTTKKIAKKIMNMFYMTPSNVSAKELKELLDKEGSLIHLWEEFNILQIEFANGNTIDFEPMKAEFKDPSDAAFIKNRKVQTIFAVTLEEDDFASAKVLFRLIVEKFDGFVCTDSDNFKPVFMLNDLA